MVVAVRSNLKRFEVLDRLQRAIGGFYKTERRDPRYLGLDGSVTGVEVILIVRPFIRPGERQLRGMLPITLRGEAVSTTGGSELRARGTAPVGRTPPAVLAAVLTAWILLGISGGLFTGAFVLLGGALMAVGWTAIIRYNQRSSLRRIDALTSILESILNDS